MPSLATRSKKPNERKGETVSRLPKSRVVFEPLTRFWWPNALDLSLEPAEVGGFIVLSAAERKTVSGLLEGIGHQYDAERTDLPYVNPDEINKVLDVSYKLRHLMPIDIFQIDPNDACKIQVSHDNGLTWGPFFDATICAPPNAIITNPTTAGRNTITTSAGVDALDVRTYQGTQGAAINDLGENMLKLYGVNTLPEASAAHWGAIVVYSPQNSKDVAYICQRFPGNPPVFEWVLIPDYNTNFVNEIYIDTPQGAFHGANFPNPNTGYGYINRIDVPNIKGDTGSAGVPGAAGRDGHSIETVTASTLPAGSSATATPSTLPDGNLAVALGIPRGADGVPGSAGRDGGQGPAGPPGKDATCQDCLTPVPPPPTPPAGQDVKCNTGAAVVLELKDFVSNILAAMNAGLSIASLTAQVVPLLVSFGSEAVATSGVSGIIGQLFSTLGTVASSVITSQFSNALYDDLTCRIFCHANVNGTYTDTKVADLLTDISTNATYPDPVSKTIVALFIQGLGARGINSAWQVYRTASADCTNCNCGDPGYAWSITLDLTSSAYGFVRESGNGDISGWRSGRGLTTGANGTFLQGHFPVVLQAASTVQFAEITAFSIQKQPLPIENGIALSLQSPSALLLLGQRDTFANGGGSFYKNQPDAPFDLSDPKLFMIIRADNADAHIVSEVWATRIKLAGSGARPQFSA